MIKDKPEPKKVMMEFLEVTDSSIPHRNLYLGTTYLSTIDLTDKISLMKRSY
jgi:hypothetical protein